MGQTASGKTGLSIELAKKFDGEIISADSRQIYKYLNIGSMKVNEHEMQGVKHFGLDIVDPSVRFTISDFAKYCKDVLSNIVSRNKLPILVGGSNQYIEAVIYGITGAESEPEHDFHKALELFETSMLFEKLDELSPLDAHRVGHQNKRRIIRAIEILTSGAEIKPLSKNLKYDTLIIGISIGKEELMQNISRRVVDRIDDMSLIHEVLDLIETKNLTHDRLQELGLEYRWTSYYLEGFVTLDEFKEKLIQKTWQYARRQMTWLKQNHDIIWIKHTEHSRAKDIVEKWISN